MHSRRTLKRISAYGAPALLACAAMISAKLLASDRGDEPSVNDPKSDIVDVYSFMAPKAATTPATGFVPNSRMVLAMTVLPNAPAGSHFASDVDHTFRIQSTADGSAPDDAVSVLLSCRFEAPISGAQNYFCNANGVYATGVTNTVKSEAADAPFRVFAGLRKDPSNGPASLVANYTSGATAPVNAYAGQSVLAIVAEIDLPTVIFGGETPAEYPLLSVSAETSR